MSVQNPQLKLSRMAALASDFEAETMRGHMEDYLRVYRGRVSQALQNDLLKAAVHFARLMKNLQHAHTPLSVRQRDGLHEARQGVPAQWVHRLDNWYSQLEILTRRLPEGVRSEGLNYLMAEPDLRNEVMMEELEAVLHYMNDARDFSRRKLFPLSDEFHATPLPSLEEKTKRVTALHEKADRPGATMEELADYQLEIEKVIEILRLVNRQAEAFQIRQRVYELVRLNLEHLSNSLSAQVLMIFQLRGFSRYKNGPELLERLLGIMNSVLRAMETVYYCKKLLLIEDSEQD